MNARLIFPVATPVCTVEPTYGFILHAYKDVGNRNIHRCHAFTSRNALAFACMAYSRHGYYTKLRKV